MASKSTEIRKKNWEKVFVFYGGRRCMICGYESDHPIYDLHHHDQEGKEVNVSKIMHHSFSKIEKELKKSILVCSNCHRTIHDIERKRKK
jgi:protein-arginine kinase activator protein McsA